MPIPLGVVAAGIGGLFKMFKGGKQNRMANKIVVPDATYKTSPYAQNILAEAQRLRNSQMPGTAAAGQNIMGNQANAVSSIQRNSSSGSQALAMLGAVQGNTNNAFQDLTKQQNLYSMSMLNNLNNANQGMTDELDKEFQDKVRKQQMAMNEKNALRGAATANTGGGMNDLINSAWASGITLGKKKE